MLKRLLAAALLVAALAAPVCAADEALRIAVAGSAVSVLTPESDDFLGRAIFEGLVRRDGALGALRPGLAERWEQAADDRKTWIFHLRPDVRFHDGSPMNADAAIWNFDRYLNERSPQFDAERSAVMRERVASVASYRKIDDMTVAIAARTSAASLPSELAALSFVAPSSFEKAEHDWAKMATVPAAGTGPFKIGPGTDPHVSVRLVRNEEYWDGERKPQLTDVVIVPINDAGARMAALQSGQVDWIEAPPSAEIERLKQAGFVLTRRSGSKLHAWVFNLGESSPLKETAVRAALNYCVDREGLVDLGSGAVEPAVGMLATNDPVFGHPKNHYDFDPGRGRTRLAKAGFGPGHPLAFKVALPGSGDRQIDEYVRANLLAACDVHVDFESVGDEPSSFSLSASTDELTRFLGRWTDEPFDKALTQASIDIDPETRRSALQRAHERLVDNPPALYLIRDVRLIATTQRVLGVTPESIDLSRIGRRP